MDNPWQTFNFNTVQVQKLLLLEWSSYCTVFWKEKDAKICTRCSAFLNKEYV